MTRHLIVRVADLFPAGAGLTGSDAVEDSVRRNLRPSMACHVVSTGAGIVVTLETIVETGLRNLIFARRGRAINDLDAVLTAVHNELDTAMAVPEAVGRGAPR